ncbi:MAG TPA: tRNA lysidine(34) synthetase TilS [Tepidisphaeraceae bacterium]|nr:tRNA lysidine(34) synthetase TilS [Tepidisphaeraceae bacterium]
MTSDLPNAINQIPPGSWAVGVSGGADSVALLALLRECRDLQLHVAHLNHQTRGSESDGDAEFVAKLSAEWHLPATIARLNEVKSQIVDKPANPSALYRAARLALFGDVVRDYRLSGVILAHHADDQAETILHRMLRGASAANLGGMRFQSKVGGLTILRPLLQTRRAALREYLRSIGQSWREDPSNESDRYARNRIRKTLKTNDELTADLLAISQASHRLRAWTKTHAPKLAATIDVDQILSLPHALAFESARQWLASRNVPREELTTPIIERLLIMASDAASAPRVHFPGGILVHRRQGRIWA